MRVRRALASAVCVAATLLCLAPSAGAEHSVLEHISIGPNGGNGPFGILGGSAQVSDDGRSVLLTTREPLLAQDTDDKLDMYLRAGGATYLVTGPSSGPFETDNYGGRLSNDGSRVNFGTPERLTADDTDSHLDLYMWWNGTFTRVSNGPSGGNDPVFNLTTLGVSEDGTHSFFRTEEQLTPDDTDSLIDAYEWRNGVTSRMGIGPGIPNFIALSRPSADRFFFATPNSLVAGDTGYTDIYEWSDASAKLVSTGPTGGDGAFDVSTVDISDDGSHAVFKTRESLVADDTDTSSDIYERFNGMTRLISTGPTGGNGPFDVNDSSEEAFGAASGGGVSADGSRIFFFTFEQLVASDTDSQRDVYVRSGNTTTLVSLGPGGGNGPHDVTGMSGISQYGTATSHDGSHAYFTTAEQLTADDTDTAVDLYEWADGVVTVVSPPCLDGPSCPGPPSFVHASRDGSRVFFSTGERIFPGGAYRLFEKHQGTVTAPPGVPVGGVQGDSFSQDGRQIVFQTRGQLVATDTDGELDVYSLSVAPSAYPRPKGASPLRIPLVPAYEPCTSSNRTHGPPLAFPSCNPPTQAPGQLTVGTPDANGQPAKSVSYLRIDSLRGDPSTPADEADVRLRADITDVRLRSDFSDYTGSLEVRLTLKITDKDNTPHPGTATVQQLTHSHPLPCGATGDTTLGATCQLDTTVEALVPGAVKELTRAIWELGAIRVHDGTGNLFMTQGIFVP